MDSQIAEPMIEEIDNDRCRHLSAIVNQQRRSALAEVLAETDEFAVGMRIAAHPPHRSERAQFRHSAPTLGGGRRSVGPAKGAGCAAAGANHQQAAETEPT
jgi:hypothetical protein